MPESAVPPWQRRIDLAERAVGGSLDAVGLLRHEVDRLAEDEQLLSTPADAAEMSYFLALLRELGDAAEREYGVALDTIKQWVNEERVPVEHRCPVHNRIATVLAESGHDWDARWALRGALKAARTPLEEAHTLTQLGAVFVRLRGRAAAREHAERAARLASQADGSAAWLDVRMRSAHTLFLIERPLQTRGRGLDLVRELVDLCGRQIDRWGNDHPRALEALVIMTAAKHAEAVAAHDLAAQERLTDALAVTAQRSASLLGARHPQARAAREALLEAHEITSQVRADEERREQDHRERARRSERELARREEAERAKARDQSAANGTRTQPREPVAGGAGEATAMFTSPLLTAVPEDRTPHDPAEDLREVIARARVVLWDFDGPICRLFAGHSADWAADGLVRWLEARGLHGLLTDEEREALDPHVVLLAVARRHPGSDLVLELEERLTLEELQAAASAMPTAYADPLIRTWTAAGVRLAVATDNSPRVVRKYLVSRGLLSCFASHVYGRTQNLHLLKPNPHCLNRALAAMGAGPSDALVIGSTPADCQAALRAGIPFLGYARNARKVKELRSVGAGLVVESLEQVLRIVRSTA
ncbi:hypothetical protein GCM10022233_67680 [Streptomyces shaanxiensis]|uniref:HAD family hydrolase n=2 Tax=Streptomyces shaanxiensis TaxID=653357 RepID=A0ABP7W0U7_9ACTN